jgi:hypothetical protein
MLSIWFLFINLLTIYISYPLVEYYLFMYYDKFQKYDRKRKNYIIKNIIKAQVLKYLSIATIPIIPFVLFGVGNVTKCVHFIGCLYTSGDTIALFKDMNMSYSTKIHHIITTSLSFVNLFIDWSNPHNIAKMMGLYCILSCYSYNVNYCLGKRFLTFEFQYKELKKNAFITYFFCCGVNWTLHIIYFLYNIQKLDIITISYYGVICLIVYDDIILLRWLQT